MQKQNSNPTEDLNKTIKTYFNSSVDYFKKRVYSNTIGYCKKIIKLNPTDKELLEKTYLYCSEAYGKMGQVENQKQLQQKISELQKEKKIAQNPQQQTNDKQTTTSINTTKWLLKLISKTNN